MSAATILVVEDDRPLRTLLVTALRRAGLEAEGAGDGAEALEIMAGGPFGLVLIDLMMPRMDGFALIDELARMSLSRRPIVIVMTAFPDASVHHLDPLCPQDQPLLLRAPTPRQQWIERVAE